VGEEEVEEQLITLTARSISEHPYAAIGLVPLGQVVPE
jgi:hypothetical protein